MAQFPVTLKVRLILYDRGKILLLRQTKENGGNYTLVGGTIEKHEFAKQCLVRESREEAGIVLKEKDLMLVHIVHKRRADGQRLVLYFKAYRWEGDLRARERNKFKAAEWFDLDQLPPNITATVQSVMTQYRQGNLYSEE